MQSRGWLGSDLVDEWKQQALALVREPQREIASRRSIGLRAAAASMLAIGGWFALASEGRLRSNALLAMLGALGVAVAVAARRATLRLREQAANLALRMQRAEEALAQDDPARALQIVQAALQVAKLAATRSRLYSLMAWAAIGRGDPFLAHGAMQRLPPTVLTVDLVAAYLACCNRRDEATQLLRDARILGQRARETSKLLIELLVHTGARQDAAVIVSEDRQLLTPSDLSALERAGIH